MKLDELHVDQLRAGVIGERMPVAGVFPTVARDLVGLADSAGREHDRFRAKNFESAALAIVAERADDAVAIFQERQNRVLHVHVDALVNAVILQRADHFQTGAIADVRESRIFMAAEISLQNAAVLGAIEDRAPGFEFAHAIGRFLRVQLGHAPLLTYWPPRIVSAKWTFQLSRSSTLASAAAIPPSAITVCALPRQRFANHADRNAGRRSFDRRAQSGAAGADHENVVLGFVFGHWGSLKRNVKVAR